MENSILSGAGGLTGVGGGIANAVESCTFALCFVSIQDGTVYGNNRPFSGGAIYNGLSGSVTVVTTYLSGNDSAFGGAGIHNLGDLDVLATTFANNEVLTAEGQPLNGHGGALMNEASGDASLANSTLVSNGAAFGGAICNKGEIHIQSSTLADNKAPGSLAFAEIDTFGGSTTYLESSVVHNSLGYASCDSGVTDDGFNIGCAGNPVATNLADDLDYNGGRYPLLTLALEPGSNAIDAGGDCFRTTDQRGVPRGDPCDAGAFEFGECADVVFNGTTVDSAETYESCEYVWVPNLVEILSGGSLVLQGGIRVSIFGPLTVRSGGELTVGNSPSP